MADVVGCAVMGAFELANRSGIFPAALAIDAILDNRKVINGITEPKEVSEFLGGTPDERAIAYKTLYKTLAEVHRANTNQAQAFELPDYDGPKILGYDMPPASDGIFESITMFDPRSEGGLYRLTKFTNKLGDESYSLTNWSDTGGGNAKGHSFEVGLHAWSSSSPRLDLKSFEVQGLDLDHALLDGSALQLAGAPMLGKVWRATENEVVSPRKANELAERAVTLLPIITA